MTNNLTPEQRRVIGMAIALKETHGSTKQKHLTPEQFSFAMISYREARDELFAAVRALEESEKKDG